MVSKKEYNDIFYAQKSHNIYSHFYSDVKVLRLNVFEKKEISRVRLKEESEMPDYWGWKDFEKKIYRHIYLCKFQVEMCSPDSFKNSIEKNKGNLVGLIVEEIEQID